VPFLVTLRQDLSCGLTLRLLWSLNTAVGRRRQSCVHDIRSTSRCLLTAKPKHRLGRALFLLKTGFWPSYCHISAELDKILQTHIVVRNTLVGRLRPRSAHGRLQAKPKRLYFYNTCNAPSVLHRDDGSPRFSAANRQSGGENGCYRKKIPEFCRVGGKIQKKTDFFRVLGYPSTVLRTAYRKQFYSKPMALMES